MADTTVNSNVGNAVPHTAGLWGPYWINTTTAGIIHAGPSTLNLETDRTIDSGANWTEGTIETGSSQHVAAWFDRETPGDTTGTLIHVLWLESIGGNAHYIAFDVNDGTLGTERTIDATVSPGTHQVNRTAITKTRNGNLIAAFLTPTEIECYKSDDSGATWSAIADPFEATSETDFFLLYPANTGDDADAAGLYWDRSANAVSVKMYDDSDGATGSWTETAILSSMGDDVRDINMDGAVMLSDSKIYAICWNDNDVATADLVSFTVAPDSIAGPTIVTSTAQVVANKDESGGASVFINQQNDYVYAAYCKGGTWQATTDIVYHLSTDKMVSWGAEQAYSEGTADDHRRVQAGRTVGDDGGFYQPVWENNDLSDLFVNLVKDTAIAAVTATTRRYTLTTLGVG